MIHFPCYIIGLMSGTSADGVDAALIYTDGKSLVRTHESVFVPYGDALRADILRLMRGEGDVASIERALTEVHIDAVAKLREASEVAAQDIKLIGFHGQTIRHAPQEGITVQIGDAALMAERLRIPVVADFRRADVAAGGQGAPLVPLYHAALAHGLDKPVMFVNIGGVANVTWIGSGWPVAGGRWSEDGCADHRSLITDHSLLAFDCGPGNALIDDWVHAHTGARYDKGGELAAKGTVDEDAVNKFLKHPFFALTPPKSLDRNQFNTVISGLSRDLLPFTHESLAGDPGIRRDDIITNGAATLTAMTAAAIARACEQVAVRPNHLFLCGGGRHNPALVHMIKRYVNGTHEMQSAPYHSSTRLRGEVRRGDWPSNFGLKLDTTRDLQTMEYASALKKNMTDAEKKLWQMLRNQQTGVKFRRQQSIGLYIVDFVAMGERLIIELDGGQHAEDRKAYDEQRTVFLNKAGYRVVRYWNNDVLQNSQGVFEDILSYMQRPGDIPPPGLPPQAGGGAHAAPLSTQNNTKVEAVEHLGLDGDMIEAQAFAYLAARSVQGLPLSLPSTTGVKAPITGGVLHEAAAHHHHDDEDDDNTSPRSCCR